MHFNTKYSNVSDAVASGETDALMVIGQFLKLDTTAAEKNSVVKAIGGLIGDIRRAESAAAAVAQAKYIKVKLGDMISLDKGFYTYAGGLTTPTCNAIVTWVVMANPVLMSNETMTKVRYAP